VVKLSIKIKNFITS